MISDSENSEQPLKELEERGWGWKIQALILVFPTNYWTTLSKSHHFLSLGQNCVWLFKESCEHQLKGQT